MGVGGRRGGKLVDESRRPTADRTDFSIVENIKKTFPKSAPKHLPNLSNINPKSTSGKVSGGPGTLWGSLGTSSGSKDAPCLRFGGLLHHLTSPIGTKWIPNWDLKSVNISKKSPPEASWKTLL